MKKKPLFTKRHTIKFPKALKSTYIGIVDGRTPKEKPWEWEKDYMILNNGMLVRKDRIKPGSLIGKEETERSLNELLSQAPPPKPEEPQKPPQPPTVYAAGRELGFPEEMKAWTQDQWTQANKRAAVEDVPWPPPKELSGG